MSEESLFWNQHLTFLNLMFSIMPSRRFSKFSIAGICGGVFLEENPNVSFWSPLASGLRKKYAFHLIRLQRCSVFSISLRLYIPCTIPWHC